MRSSSDIRNQFLSFFEQKGHKRLPSSSLVPSRDPTLLFTNAGMNQFKDIFTGRQPRTFPRVTTVQKCLRAGGKHNDLEQVGRTARHHTFFEMLGNFSFGDYFKAEAIELAWDLLTREHGIDPDKLTVTVFGGDEAMRLGPDQEAEAFWAKIAHLPQDRILHLGAKDNFWQMGETGPCGPCSEIHYDQGTRCTHPPCKGPACECDRFLEIWNLVFMQFERKTDGTLEPLPAPSVDTGMGLERLCAVLQRKQSNYETDLFVPLIEQSSQLSGKRFDPSDYQGDSVSLRAIADHARATAFLIADGVLPEKTGREYVLRRIMRRAIYHGFLLGIRDLFLHELVLRVSDMLSPHYPELAERRAMLSEVVQMEERKFRDTLERGLGMLEQELESQKGGALSGEIAFRLYDTFGFPLDLTEVIAQRHGREVDTRGYEEAMAQQRNRSSFAGSGEQANDAALQKALGGIPASEFLGYEAGESEAKVLLIFSGGQSVPSAATDSVLFVTDRTPFYGEQGGQVGDAGRATGADGLLVEIRDTQRLGEHILHVGEIVSGTLGQGATLHLAIDRWRRDAIRANHSATHLLHWALRTVLGPHVAQKGSVVAPDRLRFDFSHTRPVEAGERQTIEKLVNERIWQNLPAQTNLKSLDQAKQSGAIAFFGEKYGEQVRVVQMGESVELCGGTHVGRTGDIGLFQIVEESGIAQGIRRIVALTGPGALAHVQNMHDLLSKVASDLNVPEQEIPTKVEKLAEERRTLQKQVAELSRKLASGSSRDLLSEVKEVAGIKMLAARTEVTDPKTLREVGDGLRDRLGSGVVVLFGVAPEGGKVSLIAMVTKDLTARISAGKLIEGLAPLVGGRGGGRPDLAQAGGTKPEGVDGALSRVYELVNAQAGEK